MLHHGEKWQKNEASFKYDGSKQLQYGELILDYQCVIETKWLTWQLLKDIVTDW